MTYETGIAVLYVSAVAFFVWFGVFLKSTAIRDVQLVGGGSIIKEEYQDIFLNVLKYLYILVSPSLVLLGIQLAINMAIGATAPANAVDNLETAFTVVMWSYIITLFVVFITLVKNMVNMMFRQIAPLRRSRLGRR